MSIAFETVEAAKELAKEPKVDLFAQVIEPRPGVSEPPKDKGGEKRDAQPASGQGSDNDANSQNPTERRNQGEERKPEERKPEEQKPEDQKPEDQKPSEQNAAIPQNIYG